jgi:hypothetical protein
VTVAPRVERDAEAAYIERLRVEYNLERVRTIASIVGLGSALAVGWRLLDSGASAAELSRRTGLVMVHATSFAVSVTLALASSERAASVPWLRGVRARVAEWQSAHLCVLGGAIASLAQWTHGGAQGLLLCSIVATTMLVGSRPVLLASMVGASTVTVASALWLRSPRHAASVALLLFFFSIVTWVLSRAVWDGYRREVKARWDFERLSEELDTKVQVQTATLLANASEVERLNAVLAERVRETSRELALAMERLAKGERLATALDPGTVLGDRVCLGQPIGRGGMGIVYEAIDRASGGRVAVKVLQPRSKGQLDAMFRMLREAEASSRVEHPAIVRTEHVGLSKDGQLFIVLEYVDGRTISQVLETDHRWPIERVAAFGEALGDALATAHERGVVHRDVKPDNVMVVSDAPGVKLLDFGLALLREAAVPNKSDAEHILGTPEYLSPEQVLAPEMVGPASDVYTTGLLLYRLATGKAPYSARLASEWIARHAFAEPVSIGQALASVDDEFAAAVMACLIKNPSERPTARALSRAMGQVARRLGAVSVEASERARSGRLAERRATPPTGLSRPALPAILPANAKR